MSQPFILGVNYWPRRKAMYWWSNFEADEVREEFDVIASIGMNVVRLFLLWDDWQPESTSVSSERLRDFGTVCDIAAERGLKLDVTFFTGHMSGPNWSPRWLLEKDEPAPSPFMRQVLSQGKIVDSSYRNMFHDEEALAASRLLLRTVVSEYKDHDAIWMWNLGNEPDLFAWPHSAQAGREWVRDMRTLIREIDPVHDVTCGLHSANLLMDNGLNIDKVFAETDVAVMHGYPMYVDFARHPLDPDFMPYYCALTSALCGKPTLAEEWGGCTAPDGRDSEVWEWVTYKGVERKQFMASEEALAEHIETVLPKLVEVGATGSMLWCYADYVEELWDRPPCDPDGAKHERHFGLVRPDGSLKPHAEVIRKFAETKPMVQPAKRTVTLDITPDEYYQNPRDHAQRLYEDYIARYENGAT
ncbi:MAG: cellulase family glycosylhydrolase [Anaerolineae bacterium]|nr:cellulase family glycosylhydrolase [Anaerolineae bacterium]MCB9460640.1 cellulase family glycosylhydrolase [Anaerolineaceae bacterium]